jgi:hypothetical protein
MAKDYNKIRLVNGLEDAVYQALADIAITGLEIKIKAYKNGLITAKELVKYIESTSKQLKE